MKTNIMQEVLEYEFIADVKVIDDFDYKIMHKIEGVNMLDQDRVAVAVEIIQRLAFTDIGLYDIEFNENRKHGYTRMSIYYTRFWRH